MGLEASLLSLVSHVHSLQVQCSAHTKLTALDGVEASAKNMTMHEHTIGAHVVNDDNISSHFDVSPLCDSHQL